jgi:hypothetical protein
MNKKLILIILLCTTHVFLYSMQEGYSMPEDREDSLSLTQVSLDQFDNHLDHPSWEKYTKYKARAERHGTRVGIYRIISIGTILLSIPIFLAYLGSFHNHTELPVVSGALFSYGILLLVSDCVTGCCMGCNCD